MLTVADLTAALPDCRVAPPTGVARPEAFGRVVVDSREAGPGDLFVALPGSRTDGRHFITHALARGAGGVLTAAAPSSPVAAWWFRVSDPMDALQRCAAWNRDRCHPQVAAVTGSVGKTSTKDAIAALLSRRFRVLASAGNRNTEIGLPLTLLDLAPGHQHLVLEMGMYQRGDIALLCRLARPQVGVVTNVGPTHLARLGSMEAIAHAKAELVEALPPEGVAVLNVDDTVVAGFAARTAARAVTFGLDPAADCRAANVLSRGLEGLDFTLTWQGRSAAVTLNLAGRHHVHTALAAAAAALASGMSFDDVVAGLPGLDGGDRLRVRTTPGGVVVLDDSYNASPVSMKAALDLLGETPGRHVAVLGDMMELGEHEDAGHREVGRHLAGRAHCLVAVGTRAGIIAEAARAAGVPWVQHVPEKEAALAALWALLRPGDHVLVKGSRSMALDRLAAALDLS